MRQDAAQLALADRHGIRVHLDGARLANAMVASGLHFSEYAACADTINMCFSKGLGAPVGSILCSTEEIIGAARKKRKQFGGGMRQAGVLAAAALFALGRERAALGTAAQLIGLSRRMLDMAVQYAKDREQFGKPIGAQQAIKHRLANALIEQEFARPTVYRAGWSMATSARDASIDVSLAKIYAGQAARFVAKEALQVHGAIGYTIECDLHMWMKRTWALAAAHGDAAYHRERVGRHIL